MYEVREARITWYLDAYMPGNSKFLHPLHNIRIIFIMDDRQFFSEYKLYSYLRISAASW